MEEGCVGQGQVETQMQLRLTQGRNATRKKEEVDTTVYLKRNNWVKLKMRSMPCERDI